MMEYNKPEVFVLGSALTSVQSTEKPDPGVKDNSQGFGEGYTADAYQADE